MPVFQSSLWLAFVFTAFCHGGLLAQVDEDSEDLSQAAANCSIFEHCISNFSALSCGDFLVREKVTFNSVDSDAAELKGALLTGEILSRHIFNHKEKKVAFYKWARISETDLSFEDSESKTTMMRGFSSDGKYIFSRLFPTKMTKSKMSQVALNNAISNTSFFDVRGLGIDAIVRPNSFATAKNDAKLYSSGKKFVSMTENDEQLSLTLLLNTRETGTKVLRDYTFDLKSNMPVRFVHRYRVRKGGIYSDASGFTATFEWDERDGVYLPRRVVFDGVSARVINSVQHIGSEQRVFDFHWFSCNDVSKLEPTDFSGRSLESMKAFLDRVEPTISGADSLIEDTVPEQKK